MRAGGPVNPMLLITLVEIASQRVRHALIPRVTIRVTTRWELKASPDIAASHFHDQVRHFPNTVTQRVSPSSLPKLDVAGSNPVGRSKTRGPTGRQPVGPFDILSLLINLRQRPT